MAYQSKKERERLSAARRGFARLKEELAEGNIAGAYLFYGEESYLRNRYVSVLHKKLIPAEVDAFNFHRFEGKDLTVREIAEAAEAMPMMSERTMVLAVDYDVWRLNEDERKNLIALLDDLPEWCCLVFLYDTIPCQPNRSLRKLSAALDRHVRSVEFVPLDTADLLHWVGRRFREAGKEIDRNTAEYLLFLCGDHMEGLNQEIGKAAAYARGKAVARTDIDAVATPVLSARVFDFTDAVLKGDYERAAAILGDLLAAQNDAIYLLAALGSQLRRIYSARLALKRGKDQQWFASLWGIGAYPAKLTLSAARQADEAWCAEALKACQALDRRMKSGRGVDAEGELKLLLVRLAASRPGTVRRRVRYGG